jgi:hypothetical protein
MMCPSQGGVKAETRRGHRKEMEGHAGDKSPGAVCHLRSPSSVAVAVS